MKILNLYAGIGGNRELWENVEVTAVEIKPSIAKMYKVFYPNDKVIIADAHKYLLQHFKEFDFIWSSPPCQTHSRANYFLKAKLIRYPDLRLYEEILLLREYFSGMWVVENVIPYYEVLIQPQIIGRHCFWANFPITRIKQPKDEIGTMDGKNQKAHKKPLYQRNAIDGRLGLHIFECAFKIKQQILTAGFLLRLRRFYLTIKSLNSG